MNDDFLCFFSCDLIGVRGSTLSLSHEVPVSAKVVGRSRTYFVHIEVSLYGVNTALIQTWVRDKWLLLLKMRCCILPGGYFPDAPVYGDWAEEKRAFQADRSLPLSDSRKPLS